MTKDGTGTQTLTGANTYTGTTTITAGTLQLGNGTTGNDGTIANSLSIVDNANLTYNRFGSTSYGGVISGTGTVTSSVAGHADLNRHEYLQWWDRQSVGGTLALGNATRHAGEHRRSQCGDGIGGTLDLLNQH